MIAKYFHTESVIKNASVFSTAFVPPESGLFGREEQITRLAHIFRPILNDNISTNVMLLGSGGIGKTTLVRYFFKALRDLDTKFVIYYIDASQFSTEASILRYIGAQLRTFDGGYGYSTSALYKNIITTLEKDNQYGLFIIDEATRLKKECLFSLLNASTSFGINHSPFSFVLLSRKTDFERNMTEEIVSRLNHIIELPRFSKEQLHQILKWRVSNGFRTDVFCDANLDLLVDAVFEDRLTLREAIAVLNEAGLQCDIAKSSVINSDLLARVIKDKSASALIFREKIENLPLHEKICLLSILRHERTEAREKPLLVDDLFPIYSEIATANKIPPHVKMSFRKYIRNLKRAELIVCNVQNPSETQKGRRLLIRSLFNSAEFEQFVLKGISA